MRKGALLSFMVCLLRAQAADVIPFLTQSGESWSTYNGDASGRRFSNLTQITTSNVGSLTLAWAFQTHVTETLKSTPLFVNGVLYFTAPDHVWAVDARTGQQVWHYERPSNGNHIGQRGVAFCNGRVFFGTPDAHLIALDARDGKPIWDVRVADSAFGYYISVAPLLVKGNLIVGTSGDQADVPHFLIAFNPNSGKEVWRWKSLPDAGAPGSETWPGKEALSRGGGPTWVTGTYDPDLNLIYWGTGNPHPVLAGVVRKGDNLYTCSIVALNADTGKLVWSFQASPHDTHDWDAVETPVLLDADFHGRKRKLLAQASRNGYFFLLDRTNGEALVTAQFVPSNWAARVDDKGRPVPDPHAEPQPDGALTESNAEGATNWQAPSFDPQTGLFYVNAVRGYSVWYLAIDEGKAVDHQGGGSSDLWSQSELVALDYETGKPRWIRDNGDGMANAGILSTAGGLLFTGDMGANLLALDAATGNVLWHVAAGDPLNSAPMTYQIDGKQYVFTAVGSVAFAWSLPGLPASSSNLTRKSGTHAD